MDKTAGFIREIYLILKLYIISVLDLLNTTNSISLFFILHSQILASKRHTQN